MLKLVICAIDDNLSMVTERSTHRFASWEYRSDEDNPQMFEAIHQRISEGQSKCDEWGSARINTVKVNISILNKSILVSFCALRIFVSDPFSVDCRKEAAKKKKDKTWEGVTFLWNLLPLFPNGGKNMEYWLKPVGEKEGWSWVNPITMDCKMKECYSAPPQKSLLRPNEVSWRLVHD